MRVVETGKTVNDLLNMLLGDLDRDDLIGLARLPRPKAHERYRDILKRIYGRAGVCTAIVWLEFEDGLRRMYVFNIKAKVTEDARSYYDAGVLVEGWLIERRNNEMTHYIYAPIEFRSSGEVLPMFDSVGDKYRGAEVRATIHRAIEEEEEEVF